MKTRSQTKVEFNPIIEKIDIETNIMNRIQYEDALDKKYILSKNRIRNLNKKNRKSETYVEDIYSAKYEVIIDFDEAAKYWQQNKKPVGNSCYIYVCPEITKKGTPCGRKCHSDSQYCWMHTIHPDEDSEPDFVPRRSFRRK